MKQEFTGGFGVKLGAVATIVAAALALAACGGGGGSAGQAPFGGGQQAADAVAAQATNLILQLDRTSVTNTGSDGVNVTVTATDANNNVVADAPVTVSADTSALVIADGSGTDPTGKLTARVLAGTENRSNRTVTVTATSGTVVRQATFQVTGAKLKATVIGTSVFTSGNAGQVSYQLVDTNDTAMPGQQVSVAAFGGTHTGTTDVTGTYVYNFTAPTSAGDYTINASSAGAPADGVQIKVSSSPGAVPPVTVGIQSASVQVNPSVVPVNTPTTSPPNSGTVRAIFVAANNAPIANVRVRFDLKGDANSIGGTFSTGTSIVYSNSLGEATTLYIPANRSSPTDGVTIRACYAQTDAELAGNACPASAETTLTVASQGISVSIGTDRRLIDNTLTYIQEFVVTVVDSSGKAKSDVQITPSVDILRFGKGVWARPLNANAWVQLASQYFYQDDATRTPWYLEDPGIPAVVPIISPNAACWNEDRNRNGVLEEDEDKTTNGYSLASGGNGNGKLDPSKSDVAISVRGSDKTDAAGKVVIRIEYAKNLGSWLEYKILVSAGGVTGTEGRATWTDVLAVAQADANGTAQPPFMISRYGTQPGCNNPQ